MILAVDIGNTTIAIALIENDSIIMTEKIVSDVSDIEIIFQQTAAKMLKNCHAEKISGAVICSVVPILTEYVNHVIILEFGVNPLIVSDKTVKVITFKVDSPEKVGSDRLADVVGAVSQYGAPLIVIDMGTATTISVVNEKKEFMGGMILPGVRTALDALITNTAQLPQISLENATKSLIGKNTVDAIEMGIIHGSVCCIDGLCDKLVGEMGCNPKIIATGGNAEWIIPMCHNEIILDNQLLFKGMNVIFKQCS